MCEVSQPAPGQVSCEENLGGLSCIPPLGCVKGELTWQDLACYKGLDLTSYPLTSDTETRAGSGDVLVMLLSAVKMNNNSTPH